VLQLPHHELYVDAENSDFKAQIYADDTLNIERMSRRSGGEVVYYVIPETPRIRMSGPADARTPVFLLTKYKFGDADRNANPDLPKGGGYMLFDVELGMTDAERTRLIAHLQAKVEEAWYTRNGGRPADDAAANAYQGPTVRLAYPEYTGGSATFYLVDDENLVRGHINEQPTSLIGSNTAIFNATLTGPGATYMQRTLLGEEGEGATDLSNVQVRYDLTFWARLPPARVRARGTARNIHRAVSSVWHDYEGRGCDEDVSRTWEHNWDLNSSLQAVDIDIDTGTYDLEDDAIAELRQFVMTQLQTWLRENLLTKLEPAEAGFDDIADVYSSTDDVYRLKTVNEMTADRFEVDITLSSVVEKRLFPQATLQTFFKGYSSEQMTQFVREVDLDDDFFKKVKPTVRAFANWDMGTINYVVVDVEYNGDTQSFHFDAGDQAAKSYEWSLAADGARAYRYRYKVGFKGRSEDQALVSPWKTDVTRELNLSIPETGRLALDINAGDIDWNLVKQAQVEVRYADTDQDVDEVTYTAQLTVSEPTDAWQHDIFAPVTRPVQYRTRFFLSNESEVTSAWTDTTSRQIVVNDPAVATLSATFQTPNKWATTQRVTVNVRAEGDSASAEPLTFALDEKKSHHAWKMLVDDPDNSRFEYRFSVVYTDGSAAPYITDWSAPQDNGTTITLNWPTPPALEVMVRPFPTIKWDVTPAIDVTLEALDPAPGVDPSFSAYFEKEARTAQKWVVLVADQDTRSYRWTVNYYLENGDVKTETGVGESENFVIRPYVPADPD
jgi:hypothetical protein